MPARGRPRTRILIIGIAALLVLLAGGGLYAAFNRNGSAASESAEANGSHGPTDQSAARKPNDADKPGKHGSQHERPIQHGKHPGKEADKAGKEAGHVKKAGKEGHQASKDHSKATGGGTPGRETLSAETTGEPAYLGEHRARLGPFSVKIFDPLTRTMLRTDFHLEAVIACDDEEDFQRFFRAEFQSFREQVMIALRASDAVDFTDPKLHLLRRRIVYRVNRAMGRPFLQSVKLKDFAVYESVDNSAYSRWQPAPEQ